MTWVVGATTWFGYGMIVSDICVSWRLPDGSYKRRDCLQKIYPMGLDIIAGFSGSVKIGFALLQNLREFLRLPEDKHDFGWDPDWVAHNWPVEARDVFGSFPAAVQKSRASVILVGAHPTDDGVLGRPRTFAASMRSPDFEPDVRSDPNAILSIGMGSGVKSCKEAIQDLMGAGAYHPLMQMETGMPLGWATAVSILLTDAVRGLSDHGISKHLHVGIVTRDRYKIIPNDHRQVESDGEVEFRMPKVARSYREFREMAQQMGFTTEAAIC